VVNDSSNPERIELASPETKDEEQEHSNSSGLLRARPTQPRGQVIQQDMVNTPTAYLHVELPSPVVSSIDVESARRVHHPHHPWRWCCWR